MLYYLIFMRIFLASCKGLYLLNNKQKSQKLHFNTHVRPFLIEVNEVASMISFDRLNLDTWFTNHKAANGTLPKEKQTWQKEH